MTTAKSKKISGLTAGGTYVFTVAGVNGAGKVGSYKYNTWSYRFMRSVSPTASRGKGKITVKWKKAGGASGYQIRYSYNKSLTGSGVYTKTLKAKTLKKAIKGKKGKAIYYQVRPFKTVGGKKYLGSWSSVKSAKAK